jgi:hypothetical protein
MPQRSAVLSPSTDLTGAERCSALPPQARLMTANRPWSAGCSSIPTPCSPTLLIMSSR